VADFFISYARHDEELVRRLHDALRDRGRKIWVDWEGIPPTAEWMAEIYRAIEAAEAYVFILTPASVSSEICLLELAHAVRNNKRLVPVVGADVEASGVPETLAKLNWIFSRLQDDLDAAVDTLLEALETDLEWVRAHTRLLTRAVEWDGQRREGSLLLRGQDLNEAERWLATSSEKEPKPTPLQTEYVTSSRSAQTRRRRLALGATGLGVIIAILLGWAAVYQSQVSRLERREKLIAMARTLAETSRRDTGDLKIPLAVEAVRVAAAVTEEPVPEAVSALLDAVNLRGGIPRFEPRATGKPGTRVVSFTLAVSALAFGPDGRWLYGAARGSEVVRRWKLCLDAPEDPLCGDSPTKEVVVAPPNDPARGSVALSADARWAAATSGKDSRARLWAIDRPRENPLRLPLSSKDDTVVAIDDGGRWLATQEYRRGAIRIWNLTADDPAARPFLSSGKDGAEITHLAFGPEGSAIAFSDRANRLFLASLDGEDLRITRSIPDSGAVEALAFSPDGRWLAVGSARGPDDRARLVDLRPGASPGPAIVLRGQKGDVRVLSFSPSGRWLVAYSQGQRLLLWDLRSPDPGSEPKELPLQKDSIGSRPTVASVAFSPDEAWLASAFSSHPSSIVLWPMRSEDLIVRACRVATRNLTREEWEDHLEGQAYRDTCVMEERRK